MEAKNFILLNMMKRQLLNIYQTFAEKPYLLDDPTVNEAYEALETVTDPDEMKQWGKLMKALGLSYTEDAPVIRENNVLAELDDLASRADWKVLADFITFKCSFHAEDWAVKNAENEKLVRSIQQMAERCYDVHIIIILCGDQWVAIGNDADRLFEIYGWQTSTVSNGEEDVSFIFVSEYGYKVLMDSGYSIKTLRLGDEENVDEVFMSTCFDEDMVAECQQLIDFQRLLYKKQDEMRKFMSVNISSAWYNAGFSTLARGKLSISDDKVTVSLDGKEEIVIADGRSWRLDNVGLPYVLGIRPALGEA